MTFSTQAGISFFDQQLATCRQIGNKNNNENIRVMKQHDRNIHSIQSNQRSRFKEHPRCTSRLDCATAYHDYEQY